MPGRYHYETTSAFSDGIPGLLHVVPASCGGVTIRRMYGLIGKMIAVEGKRAELAAAMRESTADMPGCLSYVVAEDPGDENALWITEVWVDQASHQASLQLESVQRAIAKARPVIAGFGERFETRPLFGVGLA